MDRVDLVSAALRVAGPVLAFGPIVSWLNLAAEAQRQAEELLERMDDGRQARALVGAELPELGVCLDGGER